jgi:glyoxylase-like metal-dependent hydrolase (beta-lactamase superfamily II)
MTASRGSISVPASVRQWRMDDVLFTYVVDGIIALDPGVFLAAVPAEHWNAHPDQLDDSRRLMMSTGGLLVQRDGHTLLVDAGFGPLQSELPDGRVDCGALPATLAAVGVAPEDVDVLALTHLHADHTGWLFTAGFDGALTPTFPRAAYVLADHEWAPYSGGGEPPAEVPAVIEPLRGHARLTTIDDGDEVAPGVTAVVTPGHSSGHTSYVVTSATGRRLVAFGDVFHAPVQLANPQWGSAPDSAPAAVPAARARIVAELTQPDTHGFAVHFGDQPFGRVHRGDDGPRWEPVDSEVLAPPPITS